MLPIDLDTIVGIATPPGIGGVGIIRVSGEASQLIAKQILKKPCLIPNQAVYTDFLSENHEVLDSGIAIFFKSPNSFTGEDVVELQAHGGPIILDILLRRVINLGARIAEPGEFSRRAFLSNKIDLVQAESIISLIHAQTEQAAMAAVKSLQGEFSKQINLLLQDLITIRMHIEAIIDFPEDDLDALSINNIQSKIIILKKNIKTVLQQARQGSLLVRGIKAVILGKPNVGKSSLLNLLSEEERAIVTNIPGTTRDVVFNKISIDGLLIEFADTAGIRETEDLVEKLGIQRAIKEAAIADLIILMIDAKEFIATKNISIKHFLPETVNEDLFINKKIILLINKIDLNDINPEIIIKDNLTIVFGSVKSNLGINLLKQQIKKSIGFDDSQAVFTAKTRHIQALEKVHSNVRCAEQIFSASCKTWDFLAEELRLAQECLSQITGVFTNEDLLSKIFSEFCIGK